MLPLSVDLEVVAIFKGCVVWRFLGVLTFIYIMDPIVCFSVKYSSVEFVTYSVWCVFYHYGHWTETCQILHFHWNPAFTHYNTSKTWEVFKRAFLSVSHSKKWKQPTFLILTYIQLLFVFKRKKHWFISDQFSRYFEAQVIFR